MAHSALVLYTAVMMAVTIGLTGWRFAAADGKAGDQVDGFLGLCLLLSSCLFVCALLPGAQLP